LIDSDNDVHYYTMMGTEGGNLTWHPRAQWGLWNEGMITRRENGSAQFTPVAGGVIDSGLSYAVTSFLDTKNNASRRVQWGWANEENNNYALLQAGYQGAITLPREMYVIKTNNLVNTDGHLSTMGNTRVVEHGNGTFTGYTLGARPLPDVVEGLRKGAQHTSINATSTYSTSRLAGNGSSHMELKVTLSNATGPAGVVIAASPGGEEKTVIWYSPENYTINVDRSMSSGIKQFANYTMLGYFYPYTFANGTKESLHMDIFVDGSLVEVYINVSIAVPNPLVVELTKDARIASGSPPASTLRVSTAQATASGLEATLQSASPTCQYGTWTTPMCGPRDLATQAASLSLILQRRRTTTFGGPATKWLYFTNRALYTSLNRSMHK
jgi:beta-fructofuranosidase